MMKAKAFRELMSAVSDLTAHQRQWLSDALKGCRPESRATEVLESRLSESPNCPFCCGSYSWRWGQSAGLQRYRCQSCRRTFNALTGTPLAHLRYKTLWVQQAEELVAGHSVRQCAAALGIHRNTAFRWRHRFLAWPRQTQAAHLSGIAEVDETYFLASAKGCKDGLNRPPRQRGGRAAKRGLSAEQIPVLICRDRTGQTADFILDKADAPHMSEVLKPLIAPDSILCSDGSKSLASSARTLGLSHRPVNLAAGIRSIAGVYHVQNVNAYDSRLKEWMRRFHGVATDYLANYLGWRRFIERCNNHPEPQALLRASLGITGVQHLTVT